jgi:hypothetical protein
MRRPGNRSARTAKPARRREGPATAARSCRTVAPPRRPPPSASNRTCCRRLPPPHPARRGLLCPGLLLRATTSAAAPSPPAQPPPLPSRATVRRATTASRPPAPLQPSCPDGPHWGHGWQKVGRSRESRGGAGFCSSPRPNCSRVGVPEELLHGSCFTRPFGRASGFVRGAEPGEALPNAPSDSLIFLGCCDPLGGCTLQAVVVELPKEGGVCCQNLFFPF